jgi:cell division protein ZapD|tara:strand:- start:252 stop:1028 length:777 start_codon:yes stop_codon:yes gene_type:complete
MTAANHVIYEQPLNERIRTFLRLEFLFLRINKALLGDSEQENRDVVENLMNILSVFERNDLKSEIIKELERLISALSVLEGEPRVDSQMLGKLLFELDQIIDSLHINKEALGQELRNSEFLCGIRQRSIIPGGTCHFDMPGYHYWLRHVGFADRKRQLLAWSGQLSHIHNAIVTTLHLIRQSTDFSTATAVSGFYHHNLDVNQPNQLIRIQIPSEAKCFPVISAGKHRFTTRFMQFDIENRSQQVNEEIKFSLSCCSI